MGVWCWEERAFLFGFVDGDALLDKGVKADVLAFLSGGDGGWGGVGFEETGGGEVAEAGWRDSPESAIGDPAHNVRVALGVDQRRANHGARWARITIRHDQRHVFLLGIGWAIQGRERELGDKQVADGSVFEDWFACGACRGDKRG